MTLVQRTDRQRDAIEAPLGPVLVVAGPGAGKTHCLIGRVVFLLQQKLVPPHRICAVTFTNRAAEEIATRLRSSIGLPAEDITRGTLHALCLAILREHGEKTGLKRGFGVADEEYQRVVLRRLGVPRRRQGPILVRFGRHRLQGSALSREEESLFLRYGASLESQNLIDFDEIISRTATLFDRHPNIADAVSARWDYLLVDEFQDLNPTQYGILCRLAKSHGNFFAVGDDEQSIFSWTGADPGILSRFHRDHQCTPIILDENRRCSRQIFETARRLLGGNPSLFDKQLRAERESEHEVATHRFDSEREEAEWLIGDLLADRSRAGLDWGKYGILYRKHGIGRLLESMLLAAGIPCRMARGRSLRDDLVVGYVVASFRIMTSPGDPAAVEAAAEILLPEELREETRTIASRRNLDFPSALREFARVQGRGSPEAKKAWRFIYYLENLAAVFRSQKTLRGLLEELLSQRVSRYGNRLEEHYQELSDPIELSPVARLAEQLAAIGGRGTTQGVWVEPMAGLEIALRKMLVAAGFPLARDEGSARVGLRAADGGALGLPLLLFKALQLLHSREFGEGVREFVAFDLETTDRDVSSCEVVEIGAVRVVDAQIVDRFHTLVCPSKPVSALATEVHGYTAASLQGAPSFSDAWQRFRAFAGNHLLIAHNGQSFDVPVLLRMARELEGCSDLVFFDTLPLARSLFHGSRRLPDLAERFGIDTGRSHHAQDDAATLALVFDRLERQKAIRARKSSLANLLDWLGVAMALEPQRRSAEHDLFTAISAAYALGRYSDCLELYATERKHNRGEDAPEAVEVVREIERRSGLRMKSLRADKKAADRYPETLRRLERLLASSERESLDESVRQFLEQVALSNSADDIELDGHRVNLLTLHATKGLEFSRVYVVGVEDGTIPGSRELEENRVSEIEEARRLLYVGMTRAMDRLVLTHVERRGGESSGGTTFLEEMGLVAKTSIA